MTKEEAIEILTNHTQYKCNGEDLAALNMAIKALSSSENTPKQRTGRWVSQPHQKDRECSICGHCEPYKFADKEAEIFNYCPYCGCVMKGESE